VLIRKRIIKLLKDLETKNIDTVEPVLEAAVGYSYKGLPTQDFKEQLNLLSEMGKLNLARPIKSHSVFCCTRCKSSAFLLKLICPMCGSSSFAMGSAIIHDNCKHLDFERNFASSTGKMICPKCSNELKSLGLDYSRISDIYECQNCKSMHQLAPQQYICLKCLNVSASQELEILQVYTYEVNKNALSRILEGDDLMNRISDSLLALGIKCRVYTVIKGSSNISHEFPLVMYDSKESPLAVLDLLQIGQYESQEEDYLKLYILSFFGKCVDINIKHRILVTPSDLPAEMKIWGDAYDLKIVEGKTYEEVRPQIIRIISQLFPDNLSRPL